MNIQVTPERVHSALEVEGGAIVLRLVPALVPDPWVTLLFFNRQAAVRYRPQVQSPTPPLACHQECRGKWLLILSTDSLLVVLGPSLLSHRRLNHKPHRLRTHYMAPLCQRG